jgi:methyl-accepting chemotaxis protein I, serine sensor receptor
MGMSNLSVKARLFLTLSLLAVAMVGVGLLGLHALKEANAGLDEVYSHDFVSASIVNEVASLSRDNVRALDIALITGDPELLKEFQQIVERNKEIIDEQWAKYKTLSAAPDEVALADDFMKKIGEYRAVRGIVVAKLGAGQLEEARKMRVQELRPAIMSMIDVGDKLAQMQDDLAAATDKASQEAYERASWMSWIAMLFALAVAGVLGTMLARSMMTSLHTAVSVAERIAAGKLGNHIEITTQDEFGRLLTAMKDMDAKLSDIVGSVRTGADSVGSAAREISSGNDDLSQRTQEQASALE